MGELAPARVTVLLTCYNHLDYLPSALSSVFEQSYQDFDVVALDDGSTDGTREWLASLNHPRVRVVLNEENLGTYGTLNRGLEEARSEFVAVLNDDDLWGRDKLKLQVELMDGHPDVGLVHTNGCFIDGKGEEFGGEPLGFAFPRTETGNCLPALIGANKIIASAVLARRRCFEEAGGFNRDYFGSGDWEMWLRIAERWQIGYVDQRLTSYRVHGANASHKLERIWRDDLKLRLWMEGRMDEWIASGRVPAAEARGARSHNLACLGTVQALLGDPGAARKSYAASLKANPRRWQSAARWLQTFLPRKVLVNSALARTQRVHRDQLSD